MDRRLTVANLVRIPRQKIRPHTSSIFKLFVHRKRIYEQRNGVLRASLPNFVGQRRLVVRRIRLRAGYRHRTRDCDRLSDIFIIVILLTGRADAGQPQRARRTAASRRSRPPRSPLVFREARSGHRSGGCSSSGFPMDQEGPRRRDVRSIPGLKKGLLGLAAKPDCSFITPPCSIVVPHVRKAVKNTLESIPILPHLHSLSTHHE